MTKKPQTLPLKAQPVAERPTVGIPLWVTAFAVLICLIDGVYGAMSFVVQSDPVMTVPWGARSLGLAIITGMAVYFKSAILYIAAFAGGLARDVGDLIAEIGATDPSVASTVSGVVFILFGIGGIIAANVTRKSEAAARFR